MNFILNIHWLAVFLSCFTLLNVYGKYNRPRGVSISKALLYQAAENFTCFDGLKTIDFKYINDNYCDCADGSDEPGTSACPDGTFDCANHGYHSISIPSSQVNDGICDCCDGSDEFERQSTCVNRCFELGKKLRDSLEKQHRQLVAGYEMFKEYVKGGEAMKKETLAKLELLDKEKKDLEKLKSELETLKNAAEKSEQDARILYLHSQEDVTAGCLECDLTKQAADMSTEMDGNLDKIVTEAEELTPLVESDAVLDEHIYQNGEEPEQRVIKSLSSIMGVHSDEDLVYNEHTKQQISATDRARREFEEVSQKLKEVTKEIDELQMLLLEVNANQLFFIHNQCFDVYRDHFIYSLCPFHQIRRRDASADNSILIGRWSSNPNTLANESYYENGDICSNGNNMSATVLFICNASNELVFDLEADNCHHSFTLKTPAACSVPPPTSIRDPFRDEL